ncbi:hypothetical protein [Thalassoglobus sp.]|uniref:hypothetical protein n=1 Tax=Thalassoglobus sp. TaxID=2795869 RepID=UPI003AA8F9CD
MPHSPSEPENSAPNTLMHALGMNGHGYVVIPKWFVSFLSFTVSVIFVGAILWAWQMSSDVSAIKAEVRSSSQLRAAELEDIRRRLARHDELFDRLRGLE